MSGVRKYLFMAVASVLLTSVALLLQPSQMASGAFDTFLTPGSPAIPQNQSVTIHHEGLQPAPPVSPPISPPVLPPVSPPVANSTQSSSSNSSSSPPKPVEIEYFLKIDGIEGESQVAGENGAIDLMGWSWGAANPSSPTFQNDLNQELQQGSVSEFTITKYMDKASPKLFLACANGQHIKNIEIDGVADLVSGPQEFLRITLSDVIVSSYRVSGSGSQMPTEQVSFTFQKIEQQQWNQSVLQNAADQRIAYAQYMKFESESANTPLTAPTPKPQAAVDYFLKVDYLDEQSQQHTSNIDILSWNFGVTNNGEVSVSSFSLTPNPAESVSLNFAKIHLTDVTFDCVTGEHHDVVSFSFGEPAITSTQLPAAPYQAGGSGQTAPSESLSLNFAKIEMEHATSGVKAGWDLQANAPINEYNLAPMTSATHPQVSYKIPAWVQKNAKWWAEGTLSDSDFEQGIGYLISNRIIHLSTAQGGGSVANSTAPIPNWVRNDARWWSQGQISDDQMIQALQFMLEHGIIHMNRAAMQIELKTQ